MQKLGQRSALRAGAVAILGALAACDLPQEQPTRLPIATETLPPAKSFAPARAPAPARSNSDMARDFLDLHFRLEGGTELPIFTRFETPITLRLTGDPTQMLKSDLAALLYRLRREGGIDITQTTSAEASITIEAVSQDAIRRALPKAACFVVPNVSSLSEYKRKRRRTETDWSKLRERKRLAIFVPNDVAPQEVRDCLHEELAQALGPLNDLYRLSDSVFNDDNTHTVLTGFDMLMLRTTYAPELKTGQNRAEVAAQLPAILARLNPAGASRRSRPLPETPRAWINAIETAVGPNAGFEQRRQAAAASLVIARQNELQDHRLAHSLFVLGRLVQADEPVLAQQLLAGALDILRKQPGTELYQARVRSRMAAFDIVRNAPQSALTTLAPAIPAAERGQNAALLATLQLLQAEALEMNGQAEKARAVRLDSLGWARYGLGPDWAVEARMRDIAALRPRPETN